MASDEKHGGGAQVKPAVFDENETACGLARRTKSRQQGAPLRILRGAELEVAVVAGGDESDRSLAERARTVEQDYRFHWYQWFHSSKGNVLPQFQDFWYLVRTMPWNRLEPWNLGTGSWSLPSEPGPDPNRARPADLSQRGPGGVVL